MNDPFHYLETSLDDEEFSPFVKQLIVGCVEESDNSAFCSITLIRYNDFVILVDCGANFLDDVERLYGALRREDLTYDQITHLIVTHWHLDHCGNIGLFRNVELITPSFYSRSKSIGDFVTLEYYSGHSQVDGVVFISQYKAGHPRHRVVAVVGDLFECENDVLPVAMNYWKSNSYCPLDQAIAREICFNRADLIIPGHGKAFLKKPESLLTNFPLKNWANCARCEMDLIKLQNCNVYLLQLLATDTDLPNKRILVNTGYVKQSQQLIEALQNLGIKCSGVDQIVITNASPKTCGNICLFPNAIVHMADDSAAPPNSYSSNENLFVIDDGVVIFRNFGSRHHYGQYSVMVLKPFVNGEGTRRNWVVISDYFDEVLRARCNGILTHYDLGYDHDVRTDSWDGLAFNS